MNEENILEWVKDKIGANGTDVYDGEIASYINTAIMTLSQLGINREDSTSKEFFVIDGSETWIDYLGNYKNIEPVKTYIYLYSKLKFDPPANSFTLQSLKDSITELEVRLNWMAEEETTNE